MTLKRTGSKIQDDFEVILSPAPQKMKVRLGKSKLSQKPKDSKNPVTSISDLKHEIDQEDSVSEGAET